MANEGLHKSHRARLRTRYLTAGLSDFAPHNVLELLLFHAIPRRDTNPLSHALLSRFGSGGAVLSADREELLSVTGVGPGVADFLLAFRRAAELALARRAPRMRLADADSLGSYLSSLLGEEEGVALLFLDNDFGLVAERVLPGVSVHSPRFSPTLAVEEALLHHAPLCAVGHYHADGLALPSAEDLDVTRVLRNTLEAAGVRLLEHMIVGGGRFATLLYRYSGVGRVEPVPTLPTPSREEAEVLSTLLSRGHSYRADTRATRPRSSLRATAVFTACFRRRMPATPVRGCVPVLPCFFRSCFPSRPTPPPSDRCRPRVTGRRWAVISFRCCPP